MELFTLETLKRLVPIEMVDNINYLNSITDDWKETEMKTSRRTYIVRNHGEEYSLELIECLQML